MIICGIYKSPLPFPPSPESVTSSFDCKDKLSISAERRPFSTPKEVDHANFQPQRQIYQLVEWRPSPRHSTIFSHNDKLISWLNGDRHLIFQPQWQTVGRNAGHLTTTCCMHQTEQDSQSPWDSGNGVSSVSLVLKLRKCPVPNISQQMCQHCGRCQLGQGFF